MMKTIPVAAATVIAFTWSAGVAHAQSTPSPADDFIRRSDQEELNQRLDALRQSTPSATPVIAESKREQPPQSQQCFDVVGVEIDGVTLIKAKDLDAVLRKYRDRCISVEDINSVLKDVTYLYVENGYVTARLYIPEQDIAKSKRLHLVAEEGVLSDIYINGQPAAGSKTLATAFPGAIGRPVNIRDVEQGLDQINRVASNKAKTTMLPGSSTGTSILNVANETTAPWHISLTQNNLGQKQTGYSRSSISTTVDNALELNDILSLSYEHSGPHFPGTNDGNGVSNSLSGSWSVPYGYWTVSLNGSYYKYRSALPGALGNIDTSGDSAQVGVTVDRVLLRDANSITSATFGLTYKETNNFLMGSFLEVGSRRYTVGNVGLSHSRQFLGGSWIFDIGYSQGLGVFGAVNPGDASVGDADPRFSKFTGTITVSRPLDFASQSVEFTSLVNGQISPDNLLGSEQISLGGYSNVRGSRDSIAFGNNGFFLRNELIWRTRLLDDHPELHQLLGEFRPYAGLDYGRIYSQNKLGISADDVAGWTLGMRLVGGRLNADVGYSQIFEGRRTSGNRDLFFASATLRF